MTSRVSHNISIYSGNALGDDCHYDIKYMLDLILTRRFAAGALFAFEMLCQMLGRMFEPYIVNILPHLLLSFGDNNNFVRQVHVDT